MLDEKIKKQIDYKIFPAKVEKWEEVSNYVEEKLEGWNVDKKIIIELLIAVEELYVNIAHYAYKDTDKGEGDMQLGLGYIDDTIYMQFIDSGKEFNPVEKEDPDITLSAEDREIGGLGIYMCKKWADEFNYKREDNKNILTFIKKCK